MVLATNVVDYLLTVGEAVPVSIGAIGGSEPTYTNALTDLSKITTVESDAAAS